MTKADVIFNIVFYGLMIGLALGALHGTYTIGRITGHLECAEQAREPQR